MEIFMRIMALKNMVVLLLYMDSVCQSKQLNSKGLIMKRTLSLLATASFSSFIAIGLSIPGFAEGRVLDNGPIKIQLNKDPAILIKAAPKEAEMDKNHAEVHGNPGEAVLTDEQVSFLANKIAVVRKLKYKTAAALRNKNPNLKYNTYTASTYLKKWPLKEIERDYMQHIAMCPAAVLKQDLDKSTTEFQVYPYSWVSNSITEPYWTKVNVEKQSLKSGTTLNDLIPICASTSSNTKGAVRELCYDSFGTASTTNTDSKRTFLTRCCCSRISAVWGSTSGRSSTKY